MSSYDSLISSYNSKDAGSKMRVLLYGKQGSGKTTLASTFPKCLFIDTDVGMRSIRNQPDMPRIQLQRLPVGVSSFRVVMDILTDALNRTGSFAKGQPWETIETIVIDSITTLADEYFLPETMREGKRDPLKERAIFDDYGRLKIQLIQMGSVIKNLSQTMNVVTTALLEVEKDEISGALQGKPMLTGKYRDLIGAVYDEVYYMESMDMGQGKTKYILHASSYMWFEGKTRMLSKTLLENADYKSLKEAFRE